MKTTIRRYRKILADRGEYEAGSVPSRDTIVRRIRRGELPGVLEGGVWYVIDRPDPALDPRVARTVDEIVNGL